VPPSIAGHGRDERIRELGNDSETVSVKVEAEEMEEVLRKNWVREMTEGEKETLMPAILFPLQALI